MAPQTMALSSALAMTTPFVQPPSCQSIFSTTELTDYPYTTNLFYTSPTGRDIYASPTRLPVLVSNSADSRFSTCQQSGWNQGEYPFTFTAAVCPSGWVMYNAQARDVYYEHSTSRAYCCASGYTINSDSTLLRSRTLLSNTTVYVRCVSSIPDSAPFSTLPTSSATTTTTISSTTTETSSLGYNTLYPAGIAIHYPYVVEWHTTDQAKLTPHPPDLPCDVTLATWTPGSPVATESLQCSPGFEDRRREANKREVDHRYDGVIVIVIVVPIVGFLIIFGCVCCCIRSAIHSKRRKRMAHWKANHNGAVYPTLEAAQEALRAERTGAGAVAVVVPGGVVERGDSNQEPSVVGERETETETAEQVPPARETSGDDGGGTKGSGEVAQTSGR